MLNIRSILYSIIEKCVILLLTYQSDAVKSEFLPLRINE